MSRGTLIKRHINGAAGCGLMDMLCNITGQLKRHDGKTVSNAANP